MNARAERIVPPARAGFEGINRSWEPVLRTSCARILPGEFYVTSNDEVLTTILGSCVSACIRDPVIALGGLNHFLLPVQSEGDVAHAGAEARYGSYAMERLINEIIKGGGLRERLEIKIVGGGRMYESKADIGQRNIAFVFEYLQAEGLDVASRDVGGDNPRRVQYYPNTGRLRVKKLPVIQMATLERDERKFMNSMAGSAKTGDIELF